MSRWPSTQASRVLSGLLRIGWQIKRTTGSHNILQRTGWPDVVFAFHDRGEIGPRMALFLMDYPNRTCLKILGHARVEDARAQPELVAQLADPKMQSSVERLVFIDVVSFDWNCPKYITPRYSAEEVDEYAGSLKKRIAELESELRAARAGTGVSPA